MINCNNHWDAKLDPVTYMLLQVGQPISQKLQILLYIFRSQRSARRNWWATAVHFERSYCCYQYYGIRYVSGGSAFDIEEFFHA